MVRVRAAGRTGVDHITAEASRQWRIAAIEAESFRETGLRSDVVTLFQGGRYDPCTYRTDTDLGLVFAPEHAAAYFGDAAANFTFSRSAFDVAFRRAYERR